MREGVNLISDQQKIIIVISFAIDILANLNTGYYKKGILVIDRYKIFI